MAKKPARSVIGRTVTLSFCLGVRVIDRQLEDFYETLVGDFTPERATRKCRKLYDDESITIKEVATETGYYTMETLDFVKQANCKLLEG